MDTLAAFAMGEANRHKRLMVFDWDKAAQTIIDTNAEEAAAGLSGDWEYTGGLIFSNGQIVPQEETYTYLASTWATPELELNGHVIDCWRWEDETDWNASTYWPESARKILFK